MTAGNKNAMKDNHADSKNEPKVPVNNKKFPGLLKKMSFDNKKSNLIIGIGAILVVLAGTGTGWFLSNSAVAEKNQNVPQETSPSAKETGSEVGIADEETFRDTAEGILVEGGIDGEGTHHLERGLGPEKDVYLTSTVIDLQSYVDKKVQVWGETISARKAGWLMDVGKIKIIE